ncbi:hypothetical protein BDN70DRAFT_148225 [Pholiota conissans]|uniref:Nephrocystin 3-like N-terminal domain-containing protein n=1 Tax=Pholiota conissans TaxID=109636 RepID=A0A9P5YWP0_9AGAR|nr:hypothetical protein BDN70DRAFT_148225 [Pholiota conissans]
MRSQKSIRFFPPHTMFASSNVLIIGGEFVNVSESRHRIAFEKLEKASAPSALHDSSARFDPPKCHPNTRVAILEYLMGWIFGHNDPDALILWLYGPAGAGKSAILQTIAERCFERRILLASFFFGRLDPTRNTVKPFIATLAYQLTITLPQIKPLVESAIECDPLIFDKSLATQLQSLIVDPLKDLSASGFFKNPETCARLILIDGLDECQDPRMQSMVIRVLADTLRSQKLPLIFLIASRPEQHITITFNSTSAAGLWRSLVLDDSFDPEDDIRMFLVDSFEEIRTTHPLKHLVPHAWPTESDIDMLVTKSSGQFIYASVVVKYISAHHDRPHDRLEVIKGLRPARREVPFSELDAVYVHLLSSCPDSSTVIAVLGFIVIEISATKNIEILLDLQPGDVDIALAPLLSILNFRVTPSTDISISFSHASFGDFLVNASRAGQFWINTSASNEQILSSCVEKIMNPLLIDTNRHSQPGSLLLRIWGPIDTIVHHMPLTETMEEILMTMSLPRIWTAWDTITYSEMQQSIRTPISERSHFITILLSSLCPDPIVR